MEERERLLDKISKIFAKGKDAGITEAEAQSFMEKAQAMMMQHSVAEHELGLKIGKAKDYCTRIIIYKNKWTLRKLLIAGILHRHFGVRILIRHSTNENGKKMKKIEAFGTKDNVDMAEYVYNYLDITFQNLYRGYLNANGWRHNRRIANSYFEGMTVGFEKSLKDAKEAEVQKTQTMGTALMVIDKELQMAWQNHTGRTTKTTTSRFKTGMNDAFNSGFKEGRNIKVKTENRRAQPFGGDHANYN